MNHGRLSIVIRVVMGRSLLPSLHQLKRRTRRVRRHAKNSKSRTKNKANNKPRTKPRIQPRSKQNKKILFYLFNLSLWFKLKSQKLSNQLKFKQYKNRKIKFNLYLKWFRCFKRLNSLKISNKVRMKWLRLIQRSLIVQQKLLRARLLRKPYSSLLQLDFLKRSKKNLKPEKLSILNLSSNPKHLKSCGLRKKPL